MGAAKRVLSTKSSHLASVVRYNFGVILLAIDTCDVRGSVAALRDAEVLGTIPHETSEEYSSWLLPAVAKLLAGTRIALTDVDVLVAASGPGSFTGLRVGLTTIKAWSEVYEKPIAQVSRLEALAALQEQQGCPYLAAFADAQRGQVFGALFRRREGRLERIEDEMVVTAEGFVEFVGQRLGDQRVSWVSTDAERVEQTERWRARVRKGESIQQVSPILAPAIGRIGYQRALEKRLTNALELDANYVRRPDAEIFWKGNAKHDR